jgi:hypothetical protein
MATYPPFLILLHTHVRGIVGWPRVYNFKSGDRNPSCDLPLTTVVLITHGTCLW